MSESTMTVDQRQKLIAAAERALKWRRDQIMRWRIILFLVQRAWGHPTEWHDYFDCQRHHPHVLRAEWVGPYDLGNDVLEQALREYFGGQS